MKHKGKKYKRVVTDAYLVCSLCDLFDGMDCGVTMRCIVKDDKKGNAGYYKEKK